MTPIFSTSTVDQLIAMFQLHGTALLKVNVTRSEMSAIVKSGDERIATYFPKMKDARENFNRTIRAEKTVLRAEMDTKSQPYFDALEAIERRELAFKTDVPKELVATLPNPSGESLPRHAVTLHVSMQG